MLIRAWRLAPVVGCGGAWGYQDLLKVICDPKHEEHEATLERVGGGFDPEAFDVAALNKRLPKDIKLFASWR